MPIPLTVRLTCPIHLPTTAAAPLPPRYYCSHDCDRTLAPPPATAPTYHHPSLAIHACAVAFSTDLNPISCFSEPRRRLPSPAFCFCANSGFSSCRPSCAGVAAKPFFTLVAVGSYQGGFLLQLAFTLGLTTALPTRRTDLTSRSTSRQSPGRSTLRLLVPQRPYHRLAAGWRLGNSLDHDLQDSHRRPAETAPASTQRLIAIRPAPFPSAT
jgi:hypothetical protein